MSINYFGDRKTWLGVTREERLFCSHVYHRIKEPEQTKQFVEWLISRNGPSPVKDFTNKLNLDPNVYWEASFEACFYRDLLKSYGHGVKDKLERLKEIEEIGEDAVNLIKRTFDLVLFSEENIVIIEAKAASGLNSKQFKEFEMDERLIKGVFNYLNLTAPKIHFVILASSKYYSSPSFALTNGIGRLNLVDKQGTNQLKINTLISWEQLSKADLFKDDKIFERADATFH